MTTRETVVGRCRFRYVGKPWGPWFVFYERDGAIYRNMTTVALTAWRTDHRYRCRRCAHIFLGGPGTLVGHDGCPKCGNYYWDWLTFGEVT